MEQSATRWRPGGLLRIHSVLFIHPIVQWCFSHFTSLFPRSSRVVLKDIDLESPLGPSESTEAAASRDSDL